MALETSYKMDVVDVQHEALAWVRQQCKLEERSWHDGPIRCPVDLLFRLGEETGSTMLASIKQVVSRHSPQVFSHVIAHLVKPDKTARQGLTVQDVQDG
jgi:hypothetical protein